MFNLILARVFSIVIGLLFVITSCLKIKDLKGFANITKAYGILPKKLLFLCYIQPFIELVVGLLLIFEIKMVFSSFLALGLFGIATIFTVIPLIQGKKIDNCGCCGVDIKIPLTWKKVVENLIWMLLATYIIIAYL
ncbi:hypothetical protein HYT58_00385 [Candidatus Woesearchaeota archaeon]|nr:hypothetical protein [Candidatus Woesearchaeota archaeon]